VWKWCIEERLKLIKSKPWKKNALSSTKSSSFICFPSYFLSLFFSLPLSIFFLCHNLEVRTQVKRTYNKKTLNTLNMITFDASFCEYGRCYFPKSYYCNDKMVKPRRSICVIVHRVIFHMLMAKLTRLWQLLLSNYVVCSASNS
jgi:hypothetical protein